MHLSVSFVVEDPVHEKGNFLLWDHPLTAAQ